MATLTLTRPNIDRTLPPVEQAYQYMLESILSGEFTPGMRVPADAVAEALGISRMPVRDALRRLEGDGAVMIYPNRGAAVAEYSRDEVTQLIEMRAVLEGLAARLAVPNVSTVELAELRHRKLQMERSADDLAKWMGYHDGFHNYLTSLSGRPLLLKQTERMRLMLNPYYRRYYEQSRELEIFGLEHQKIIDTIEYKDANHLEQIVRGHALVNVEKIASFA
ncbi:MAG TPA: GntR family transcriptional regulator [Burkholderiales bacterium]|nr:GntR family transcriptional regulator [Burkholderiales bacterium]